MKFIPLGNSDARLIEPVVHGDDRGNFARTWCVNSCWGQGIDFNPVQRNMIFTRFRGTVRGMHFQRAPKADAKLVRCTMGHIHEVIVEDSMTRGQIYVDQLAADIATMLDVPPGLAHGFQTLSDDTIVEYQMGVENVPDLYDGFRYDDPMIGIPWPETRSSFANDTGWPLLADRNFWPGKRGS